MSDINQNFVILYCLLCVFAAAFYYQMLGLIRSYRKNAIGQSLVSGEGEFEIKSYRRPKSVEVEFVGDQNYVPCNPAEDDYVCSYVDDKFCSRYSVFIKWKVGGIRVIRWVIKY
jgi:hypothetical protein